MRAYGEDHWYGRSGWPTLRKAIFRLACGELAARRSADEERPTDVARFAEDFVAALIVAIDRRRIAEQEDRRYGEGSFDYVPSKWDFALALFGDIAPLRVALTRDHARLLGRSDWDISPEQALGSLLRQFLEGGRRQQMPATEHRQKVWETIERASIEVAATDRSGKPMDRCGDDHIVAVQALLQEKYPRSKNVNLSKDALRAYFYEFCPDCNAEFEWESEAFEASISEILQSLNCEVPSIGGCLDRLRSDDPDGWETVMIKFEFDDLPKMTAGNYMTSRQISRHRFDKLFREAFDRLRLCLQATVDFVYGGRG
jgi:hypothetical protein